ncbi:HAD family hydrolase [Actinacidiphila sp. ITFR-21]|uniref:HAD family hydrolase n=1 Tax=Actinacidiphila sp. ITFR-21 TaxID=3075199 RepID=UPI00288BB73D|nr:haloacid dehalogenase-like hydrolase [Streptomyces sp. ITFR-21]WNI15744.1 haloacid dehalogenase-like hydrolase [Streptomyces sp. ITFR-21]
MPDDSAPPGHGGPGPALVLWDVDHTLIRIGGGVSRALYEHAFREVTGRPLVALADMAGRTDRAITLETLRLNAVDRPERLLGGFYAALAEAAEALAGRMREVGEVLPGAREAVAAFAGRRAVQTAVTGNLRPVALAKLTALGMTGTVDLTVGGYGDDGSDRADLVRRARARAAGKYGFGFPGRRTIVIGDTPHDIRGAHDAGAFAVGVATGNTPAGALQAAGADIVLPSLTEHALLAHAVDGD